MTTTPNTPNALGDRPEEPLPPELAALVADLDRLAAAEARAAGPSLEDRVLLRTRAAATHEGMTPDVRRVNQGMTAVAARDAASAPAGFEDRVFEASVGELHAAPPVVAVFTRARWAARLAVAAGLALAAVAGYVALTSTPAGQGRGTLAANPTTPANPTNPSAPEPAKETLALSGDLEQILSSTEAEASFAALFAMNVDTLGSEISNASQEAERLDRALVHEPAADATTTGG